MKNDDNTFTTTFYMHRWNIMTVKFKCLDTRLRGNPGSLAKSKQNTWEFKKSTVTNEFKYNDFRTVSIMLG